ncbi:MAG: hypothetical protein M0042_08870 [Nitrospiraceae bacterium]|nr:hypothetical protein [Nitrospiraceae bacterium]
MDTDIVEAEQVITRKMNSEFPEHLHKSVQVTTGYVYSVLQILDSLTFSYKRKADEVKTEAQKVYSILFKGPDVERISIPDSGKTIYDILECIERIAYNKYLEAVAEIYAEESDDIESIIRGAKFFTRIYKYRLGLKDQNIPRKLKKHKQSIFTFEYKNLLDFCDMADSFLQQEKPDLAIDALRTLIRLIWFYSPYIRRPAGSELVRLDYRGHWIDLNLDHVLEQGIEIAKHAANTSKAEQGLRAAAEELILKLSEAREQI